MTNADWQALIESYLSGENDTELFREEFIEGWKSAIDEKSKIPAFITKLHDVIEAFEGDDDKDISEQDVRDAAERALARLQATTD